MSRLKADYYMPEEKPFHEPRRVVLSKIYTRTGDTGQTALVGGQRVAKDTLRIDAYGTVDELNSFIGAARASVEQLAARHTDIGTLCPILKRVQHELFNLGSILATLPEDVHSQQPRITGAEIARLEREIDEGNEVLPVLRSFVLPGATRLDAELHVCRTVCRRAERELVALSREEPVPAETVQYLNRLSDALFVWSRWINTKMGVAETLWEPNAASSGLPR
jgi:cob(I)alamin adenosyltransferase